MDELKIGYALIVLRCPVFRRGEIFFAPTIMWNLGMNGVKIVFIVQRRSAPTWILGGETIMLAEDIEQKALKLSAVKRIRLVEALLDSLDKTDPEIEKIWIQESEYRYQAYKEGRVEGLTLEQVRNNSSYLSGS